MEPNWNFVHQYMRGLSGMDTHKDKPVVFGAITLVLDDENAATQAGFYTQKTLEYENPDAPIVRNYVSAKAGMCILTPMHVAHCVGIVNRTKSRMSVNFFY